MSLLDPYSSLTADPVGDVNKLKEALGVSPSSPSVVTNEVSSTPQLTELPLRPRAPVPERW